MKAMKEWFDIHETFNGSGHIAPNSRSDDSRLLWLQNDITSYLEKIQLNSIESVNDGFTNETYQALFFTAKSTVETTKLLLEQGVSYVLTKKLNSAATLSKRFSVR